MGEEKRIIGPPGCGKTTAVASEVSHAVALGKSVMLASLTKASAAELGGRMMPIAKRRIGTLHSHCYWALSYPELAESHIDQWNEEHPGQQLNLNNDLDDVTSSSSDYAFAQYQLYRARMESIPEHRTHIRSLAADWEKWKEQYGYLDFTDLIETCLYDVDHAPENPDVICIDEAQDHSALEMALVRKWGEQARELIVVGDPLQAIFDWRGADPEVFYTPEIDNQIILDQSYRVPRAVHTKAMSWIEGMPGYRPILYHPTEVEGEVRRMGGSWKGADQALSIVRPYLEQGKSVMFLTTCGYMLGPLIKTLREQGIPYHNPYRPQSGQWNPLSTRRGATSAAERLAAFLKPSMGQQWTIEDVKCWSDICAAKTLAVKKEALDSFDAGVPLPNMMLGVLLDDEGVEAAVHGDLNWYREHLLASRKKTMEFPMQVYRRNGPEKLVHPPQITVGTIHSVKGGEADVVYMWPDLSRQGYDQWMVDRAPIYRLMYVAMTRAKETLIIGGGNASC